MPSSERTTMSDDGDKVCPLCAEEMDLTDQQLKPCKCGYEICVWCWHHIMEMAEKEETDGRCPACRTPYDKERIVGMSANCESLVSGANIEKRHKSYKAKPKPSAETRKQLSTVRVIQRNLVYIIGLPANLCDENLLERKEYFGQYGKILKVSISRPTSTTNQQGSTNNTFSVYITYAREDEAVRCIQAVHNYILDGKPLRACFGTTKYCHAWLRNMNCSNPDCLYLHDIGSQEDSFTKDEIISAHTRSRVSQIPTSSLQRRSGIMLPPPTDDWACNGTSTGKQLMKNASNNSMGQPKVSNGSIGRPTILPAAASCRGSRPSNGRSDSQTFIKENVDINSGSCAHYSVNSDTKLASSAWHDVVLTSDGEGKHIVIADGNASVSEPTKAVVSTNHQLAMSDFSNIPLQSVACDRRESAWDDEFPEESYDSMDSARPKLMPPTISSALDTKQQKSEISLPLNSTPPETEDTAACFFPSPIEKDDGIFSIALKKVNAVIGTALESSENNSVVLGTDKNEHTTSLCNDSFSNLLKIPASKSNQNDHSERFGNSNLPPTSLVHISPSVQTSIEPGLKSESEQQVFQSTCNMMEDPSLVNAMQIDPDAICQSSCSPHLVESFNKSTGLTKSGINKPALTAVPSSFEGSIVLSGSVKVLPSFQKDGDKFVDNQQGDLNEIQMPSCSFESALMSSNGVSKNLDRVYNFDRTEKCSSVQNGENSSFSDILSLDFDPWDDSLSIDNLSKLLGENDRKEGSILFSRPLNTPNTNQSRFSFARQESQESLIESAVISNNHDHGHRISVKDSLGDDFQKLLMANGFLGNGIANNSTSFTADRPVGVSLAKVSAPPGFSTPNRAPPPGFSVQNRQEQNFGTASEIHPHGNSYGDCYQIYGSENSGDIEFIDPAILAVGKGHMPIGASNASFSFSSALPAHFGSPECDPRLQLLMHQSISSHQNMRVPEHTRSSPLPANDSYLSSCLLAKNYSSLSPFAHLSSLQPSRSSHVTSNQWDGWSNMQTSTDVGMNDIMGNERFRLNNFYLGKAEHNFHIPSSGDIYGRAFGM